MLNVTTIGYDGNTSDMIKKYQLLSSANCIVSYIDHKQMIHHASQCSANKGNYGQASIGM